MRAPQVKQTIIELVQKNIRRPIYIEGPPGTGKSSVVRQACEELDSYFRAKEKSDRPQFGFIDLRPPLMDPSDLRGIPIPNEGVAQWLAPEFLPQIPRDPKRGIILADELADAAPLVQSSWLQLTLDFKVGEYTLPPGWMVIAASNRQQDKAGAHRIISSLANRFTWIKFEHHLDDWVLWALETKINPAVIGYLKWRPDSFFTFKPERNDHAFATPRTWEYVSQYMPINPDIRAELICGAVGDGPGQEFISFLKVMNDLPNIDAILDGKITELPKDKLRGDVLYATVASCASRCEDKHVDTLIKFCMNMPSEFAVLMVKFLQFQHRNALAQSKSYRDKFIAKYSEDIAG